MEWISADRTPDVDGMIVAVYDPTNPVCKVWPATWDAKNRSYTANGGWFEHDEITHWMPLPPAPSSTQQGEGK